MPWWGWMLVGWSVLAVAVAAWVAAAARVARRRERAARAHQYEDAAGEQWREAG
jgi:hypothetical protein